MPTETTLDTICRIPDREERLSLRGLLPYVPRSARRILDCTGHGGARAAAFRAHGASYVFGMLDGTVGSLPEDHGYDEVAQGPLDFLAPPGAPSSFDCIVCTGALERLRNPEAFLPTLLSRLVPGGMFLATVPNMQYHKIVCALSEGRWVYGESGVWAKENLCFYTGRELAWLMNRAGIGTCKLGSIVADAPDAFPRGDDGHVRVGRLNIGPIDEDAYPAWLTEYYILVGVKPN